MPALPKSPVGIVISGPWRRVRATKPAVLEALINFRTELPCQRQDHDDPNRPYTALTGLRIDGTDLRAIARFDLAFMNEPGIIRGYDAL